MSVGKKNDIGKPRWELLPLWVVEEVVKVLTHGSKKYADDNWKKVEPFEGRYLAAAMRHITDWQCGNKRDKDSGLLTLAHAICCLVFLLWKDMGGTNES